MPRRPARLSGLILDINECVENECIEAAAGDRARGVIMGRLRSALDREG